MGRHSTPEAASPESVSATRLIADSNGAATDRSGAQRRNSGFWIATAVFWLLGLGAGFVAALVVVARVGCTAGANGLACTNAGSVVGALLLLAVIVTVGTTSVFAAEVRTEPRRWLGRYALAVLPLVAVVVAARLLASTL